MTDPQALSALRAAADLADAVRRNIVAAVRLQSGKITDDEFDATTRAVHSALQRFDWVLAPFESGHQEGPRRPGGEVGGGRDQSSGSEGDGDGDGEPPLGRRAQRGGAA